MGMIKRLLEEVMEIFDREGFDAAVKYLAKKYKISYEEAKKEVEGLIDF